MARAYTIKTPAKALIMSGYGVNSEMETQEALMRAGMASEIVHINDLIAGEKTLADYRLDGVPAVLLRRRYGPGNAYANRVRNNLWDDVKDFLRETTSSSGSATGSRSSPTSAWCRRSTGTTPATSP
jgi:phosphoribosylformylglycinamidine synthase